jgi:hypothetical protein
MAEFCLILSRISTGFRISTPYAAKQKVERQLTERCDPIQEFSDKIIEQA